MNTQGLSRLSDFQCGGQTNSHKRYHRETSN